MAINTNFDKLEPTAWVREILANDFPARPFLRRSQANIAGVNIAGQVASKNKTVKVSKAVKPTGDAPTYTGSYTPDTLDVTNTDLLMEDPIYRQFKIDKWDQEFSLPDLVDMHVVPRIQNIADTISKNYLKREADKFVVRIVDDNSGASVIDDEDVRFVSRALQERHFVDQMNMSAYLDPGGQADLKGLPIFQEGDKRGDTQTQRAAGIIGQYNGFNFFTEGRSRDVSNTGSTGNAVMNAAGSKGDTVISVDNGAGSSSNNDLVEDDTILIGSSATQDRFYAVESATVDAITLKEPLREDFGDDTPVADAPAGTAQYFLADGSISVVTAIPRQSRVTDGSGVERVRFFEPTNGINFLLTFERDTSGLLVTMETLPGAKNFFPTRGGIYIRGENAK